MFGERTFGAAAFGAGGQAAAASSVADLASNYTIHVFDDDGVWLGTLDGAIEGGTWRRQLNMADDITLTLASSVVSDRALWGALTRPNVLRLYDRAMNWLQTFEISGRRDSAIGRERVVVTGQSLISRLLRYHVIDYTTSAKAVADIVADFLDYQDASYSPIDVGRIDSAIGGQVRRVEYDSEKPTVLKALTHMRDLVGGYMTVSPAGKLFWTAQAGANNGMDFHRTANMSHVKVDYEPGRIVNRVYAYGAVENGTRVELDAVTYPNGFVEDAASVAAYGPISMVLDDKRIKHAETLGQAAELELARRKELPYSIEIDGAKLDELRDADWSHMAFALGDKVMVRDETLLDVDGNAFAVQCEVIGMDVDLARPLQLRVELRRVLPVLDDRGRLTFESLLADLLERDDDLAAGQGDPVEYADDTAGDFPEVVAPGNESAGTSAKVMRADAQIPFNQTEFDDMFGDAIGENYDKTIQYVPLYTADEVANLPSAPLQGSVGVTTGTNKYTYMFLDGSWISLSHLVAKYTP